MIWDDTGLVIEGVEIIEIDNEDLAAHLQALYELTYKYDQIDMHRWAGDEPKAELLAVASAGIYDVGRRIAEMLQDVFADWLRSHAINDPVDWGMARAEALIEDDIEMSGWFSAARHSFAELAMYRDTGTFSNRDYRHYYPEFYATLRENITGMPGLLELAKTFANETNERLLEDWEEYGKEEGDPAPEEIGPEDVFDYGFEDLVLENLAQVTDPDWAEGVMAEIYAVAVFPLWYGRWGPEGIDATRERVERAYEKLERIVANPKLIPVRQLATDLNLIINTMHQTGSMLDYVNNRYYQVDKGFLDALSEWNEPDADEELEEMGVLPEIDGDAVARRRAVAQGEEIVRDAWRRLARYEQIGENPRMTLQEVVLEEIGDVR